MLQVSMKPSSYCFRGKLRTIIGADILRDTTEDEEVKQEVDHILILNLPGYQYSQALAGIFVDDIQYLKRPAVSRVVYHEVIAPDVILVFRPQPYTGPVVKP